MYLKDRLSDLHPVVGDDYHLLTGDQTLKETDETACVSCLLSIESVGGEWVSVIPMWKDDIGKKISEILNPDSEDADWTERVFRRKLGS